MPPLACLGPARETRSLPRPGTCLITRLPSRLRSFRPVDDGQSRDDRLPGWGFDASERLCAAHDARRSVQLRGCVLSPVARSRTPDRGPNRRVGARARDGPVPRAAVRRRAGRPPSGPRYRLHRERRGTARDKRASTLPRSSRLVRDEVRRACLTRNAAWSRVRTRNSGRRPASLGHAVRERACGRSSRGCGRGPLGWDARAGRRSPARRPARSRPWSDRRSGLGVPASPEEQIMRSWGRLLTG
jgi:hypothetical protein